MKPDDSLERMAYRNKGRRSPRHAFLFQVAGQKPIKVFAKVIPAREAVTFTLTEAHIKRALKLDGRGDAQNCAGACCSKDEDNIRRLPHTFTGHTDWLNHRAYLSNANTSIGLPKSCIAYRLRGVARKIAPLFDSKTGLRRLLEMVRRNGGSLEITLEPPSYSVREKNRPKGKPGEPQRRVVGAKGQKLRLTNIGSGAAWFKLAAKAA